MRVSLKFIIQIISIISICVFMIVLELWVTNNQVLYSPIGFVIWSIPIIAGGFIAWLIWKYKIPTLLAKVSLAIGILSISLAILTVFIFLTVSSMP